MAGRGSVAMRIAASDAVPATAEEVEFKWQGTGEEVLLTGDFLNWDSKLTLSKGPDGSFVTKQKLPPGRYVYKFIVDGVWQHSQYHPTVADGAGGFNNSLYIEAPKKASPPAPEAAAADAPLPADSPAPAAVKPPAGKTAGAAAAAGGKKVIAGKKAAAKSIGAAMEEDIIPGIMAQLSKEKGLAGLSLKFDSNELRGSFVKNGIPYDFWAYFPDGSLEGSRGFSLTSCGFPPSTVEPFIIDERKVTPELVVFWVIKRLFAQKLLSLN